MLTRSLEFARDVDSAQLPEHLADSLRSVHATDVVVSQRGVTFRAGMFRFVSNWNVLVPFTRGELVVDETAKRLRYRVSFLQLFAVLVLFTVLAIVVMPRQGFSPGMVPVAVALIWIWLGGGNLVIGLVRFERFLRRAMSSAPRRASPMDAT